MKQKDEKWALFWCDLLRSIIYEDIEPEQINQFLKECAQTKVMFPDGTVRRPSLSTLRRKLNLYKEGGFNALARKRRTDLGGCRSVDPQIMEYATLLKKDQPRRSEQTINTFLKERFGVTVPRSTLFRHLKDAGATKVKLGVTRKKVRTRWTREHTNDLWVGDFEEGPYVLVGDQTLPTHLSAFIDCHSRYVVEARYYLRQNLDILIDSLIRAISTHGAPAELYLDNAKVYHATALKKACYRLGIKLRYRPVRDAATGGLIERLFQTAQSQFEAEVRAREILTLEKLNRGLSAWLSVQYHPNVHSETGQTPKKLYQQGLRCIRQVDMQEFLVAFMQRVPRTVNPTFSDVRLNNRYYKVDPRLRGDRLEVRFDPFGTLNEVHLYSLKDESFLGKGTLHHRESADPAFAANNHSKAQNDYLDLIIERHDRELESQTQGIDYTRVNQTKSWPFHDFARKLAGLMGKKGGLTEFRSDELEALQKFYQRHTGISEEMLRKAYTQAYEKTVPYIILEIQEILKEK